jgi:L-asparagine transporter-like permease
MHIPNPFWPWIAAAFLWYTSAVLILSSRDVQLFAPFIYWEALLRFLAVLVLIAYGFTYVGVFATVLFAITDFAWGICYVVGLRRVTGRSHASILLARRA